MPVEKVIIFGLGVAGPLAALAILARTSIPSVTIYEYRAAPSTIGGALNLPPNALRLLNRLNVLPTYGAPTPSILLQNENGTRIGEVKYGGGSEGQQWARGYMGIRVLRTDLLRGLLAALEPYVESGRLKVVFSQHATRIDESESGATVYFSNGATDTADLILGADGIHSFVRSHLYKDAPPGTIIPKATYTGLTMTYGIVPSATLPSCVVSPLRSHHAIGTMSRKSGLFTVSSATSSLSHIYWFSSRTPATPPSPHTHEAFPASVRSDLMVHFGHFPPPVPDIIRSTERIAYWPVYSLSPSVDKWYSKTGRVVLLGDAAHPMPPHAAQGVGMGIEDAMHIANILSAIESHSDRGTLSADIWAREYQEKRQERVEGFQRQAKRMSVDGKGELGWEEGRFKEWAIWALLPAMSWAGNQRDVQGWAYDIDEETVTLEDLQPKADPFDVGL